MMSVTAVVVEQRLQRPEPDHVVDEQPHDRAQLGGVQLDLQVDDDLLDDLGDLVAQLLRPERRGDRDVDALHQQRHHLRLHLQLALVLLLGRVLRPRSRPADRAADRRRRLGLGRRRAPQRRARRACVSTTSRRSWRCSVSVGLASARRRPGASSTSLASSASCSGLAFASPSGPSLWRSRSLAAARSIDSGSRPRSRSARVRLPSRLLPLRPAPEEAAAGLRPPPARRRARCRAGAGR